MAKQLLNPHNYLVRKVMPLAQIFYYIKNLNSNVKILKKYSEQKIYYCK